MCMPGLSPGVKGQQEPHQTECIVEVGSSLSLPGCVRISSGWGCGWACKPPCLPLGGFGDDKDAYIQEMNILVHCECVSSFELVLRLPHYHFDCGDDKLNLRK